MSGANAAGIYVGPYHFAHVESLSPAGTVSFDNYAGGAFAYDSPTQANRDAWLDATLEAVDFIKRIRPYYLQTGNTHYLPSSLRYRAGIHAEPCHTGIEN